MKAVAMCGTKHRALFLSLFISLFLSARCDIEVQVLTKANACESTCDEAFPTSPANASRCRRGCRLLRLAQLTLPDGDGAASCRDACAEAHVDAAQRAACLVGCAAAAPFPFQGFPGAGADAGAEVEVSWAVYVQGGADALPMQTDFESADVLTDPGLRRQLQLELGAEELPQTHVRSMDKLPVRRPGNGDGPAWCGLPSYANLLLVAVGCALALYLCAADARPELRGTDKPMAAAVDDAGKHDLDDLPPKYSELQTA